MKNKKLCLDEYVKSILLKRLTVLLYMTVGMSVVIGILVQNIFSIRTEVLVIMAVATTVFVLNTVGFCRWFYLTLMNPKLYYILSFGVHTVFALVNVACCFLLPNVVYSWGFVLTKQLVFLVPGTSPFLSLAVFHLLLFIVISVSPLAVRWIADEEKSAPEIGFLHIKDEASADKEEQ